MWWDGKSFGPGEIALVAYTCDPNSPAAAGKPLLGAAATDDTAAALAPDQFRPFLLAHPDVQLVCYDVANLHWLLDGSFRANGPARELLWAFSRESRMIDIMLLDQHVRRWHDRTGTQAAASLQAIAQRCEADLPDDLGIRDQVEAAGRLPNQPLEPALLELLRRIAKITLQVYRHLRSQAEAILASVELATLRPAIFDPPSGQTTEVVNSFMAMVKAVYAEQTASQQKKTCSKDDAPESNAVVPAGRQAGQSTYSYGLLGIGIDTQAAIALQRPDRPSLMVNLERWPAIAQQIDERYRAACLRLFADHDARPCFKWTTVEGDGKLVARRPDGSPEHIAPALKNWLRQTADRLCNLDKLPAEIPVTQTGDPSFDSERWSIWADCDPSLSAWRQMNRMARLEQEFANRESVRPAYDVFPAIRARAPDLNALREIWNAQIRSRHRGHVDGNHVRQQPGFEGSLLIPRTDAVFVVGTLRELNLRSFAAVCEQSHYSHRGRLAGYLLHRPDPIETIASELYALMERESSATSNDAAGGAAGAVARAAADLPTRPSFDEAKEQFLAMRENDPQLYDYHRKVAEALLESLPLGLPNPLLAILLHERYGLNTVGGVRAERIRHAVQEWMVYELEDYLQDDVLCRLARVLGISSDEAMTRFVNDEHVETRDAALRNDLLKRPKNSALWRYIRQRRAVDMPSALPSDDELVKLVLRRAEKTIAGRLIAAASPFEARRQQCRLAADEAVKVVAYALVAKGFDLVAIVDNQFVLEISVNQAAAAFQNELNGLIREAHAPILGPLATPCSWQLADHWPANEN